MRIKLILLGSVLMVIFLFSVIGGGGADKDINTDESIMPVVIDEEIEPEPEMSIEMAAEQPVPEKDRSETINYWSPEEIEKWYGELVPLTLGGVELRASVADTLDERQKGLSGTPGLPPKVVKLFIFDQSDRWSFWMKDMEYPIDIIWLDASKKVVYIKENAQPETYPESFLPSLPSKYVIETVAGFASQHELGIGNEATFDW